MSAISPLDIALDYIARGWSPLPVPYRTKKCILDGWPGLRITAADAPTYFNGQPQNVGVHMGPASNNLADVDLDCDEAPAVAPFFLPETKARFGRKSFRNCHWLYVTDLAATREGATIEFKAPKQPFSQEQALMLVELRIGAGKGAQTVFPGSVHEEGEPIEWERDGGGEPLRIDGDDLLRRVTHIAAASLLARSWPPNGSHVQHDAARVLGGFLARAKFDVSHVKLFTEAVAVAAKDGDPKNRIAAAADAAKAFAEGKNTFGVPAMKEAFGELVAKKVAEWLEYNSDADAGGAGAGADADAGAGAGDGVDPGDYGDPPWEEPLDLIGDPALVGWPELTEDCLPAPLFRYVMADADRLNVDPCALAGHVLAACAASISDAWSIKPKRYDRWTQNARLWVCIIKDVGSRGTDMIRSAFWPVRERDHELFERWQQEHAAWSARQKKKGRNADDDDGNDPEPRALRLVTDDATVEALSEILKDGGDYSKATYYTDELVAFIGGFGRYTSNGGAARSKMLEAYDGGPQRIDRIKRGHVFVRNWSMNVAGNIQTRKLAGMAKDLIDDGFFQRFLKLHQRPPILGRDDDRPIAASIGSDYRHLHTVLAELQPAKSEGKPVPVYVEDEGHAVRQRFMRLVERLQADPTLPTIIRETAPKWSGLHARLSLIYHMVELAQKIIDGAKPEGHERYCVTGATVSMAATFLRRIALPNLFRLGYETIAEEGCPAHARWLAGYILAHESTTISAREIGRAYRALRGKPQEIAQTMDVLVHAGWALPLGNGRHDSSAWAVNPAVHSCFAQAAATERERREAVRHAEKTKVADL